jgi:hypothetical protein
MFQALAIAAILIAQQVPTINPGGIEAIGPKQDDPLTACAPGEDAKTGIIVQGGREAIGPKQDDPRKLAIGPKQDDPLRAPVLARPGDDNDPKASGGSGIIVQGGVEAIGPKQDDPRAPGRLLAIGPKQDDPRSPAAVVARPGDDEDPQARAQACEIMQR